MSLRQTLGISAVFAVALHLAGCERPVPSPASEEPTQSAGATPVDTASAQPEATATALPPPQLIPQPPPPGAPPLDPIPPAPPPPSVYQPMRDPAAVLSRWGAAIEQRDWATVRALWGNRGADSGLPARAFAAKWDALRHPRVAIGQGEEEGAAGSLYYSAPVTVIDGASRKTATVTLRRVDDVPGASMEQLRWHFDATTHAPWP